MTLGDMNVRHVYNQPGNWRSIDPPFDPEWSDLTKLRWKTGVLNLDGCEVRVSYAQLHDDVLDEIHDAYYISMPGRSVGAVSYNQAWGILEGVGLGYGSAKFKLTKAVQEAGLDNTPMWWT